MNKELKEFVKEINKGKIRGSQQIIAKALGIDYTSVSKWYSGKNKPSEENIIKMANIFKKDAEEIKKIFFSNTTEQREENIGRNEIELLKKEIVLRDEKISILEKQIKFLEEQVAFYKEKLKNH